MMNRPSEEQLYYLIKRLEPRNLPKQYFFATPRAISKLRVKRKKVIL